MRHINKILIANRGEIAVRIIRSCSSLGIQTVAVYSEVDVFAPHVRMADESIFIGPAASSQSYLVMDTIIEAATSSGAQAIHPGYGFLSENATFANKCQEAGIIFIGPPPNAIELMGDKMKARALVQELGIPFPQGLVEPILPENNVDQIAHEIGYPILIKAAAGGGGKGMRIVHKESELSNAVKIAASEAQNAFGDARVYIEKYLENPRHVEIQVLADEHGQYFHLFDRECSIQRRHQKVVEEAPCVILNDDLRKKMAQSAIEIARSCEYHGVGTVEFLVDNHLDYYFLEMNTRLQVEHPVTEMITGLDLVELQIQVARGEKLDLIQQDIKIQGHAIECRIYAEDPFHNFLPDIGFLSKHRIPSGLGIRVDTGVEEGAEVSIHYDPLISKLSVHADDREKAIHKMKAALGEYEIEGCQSTIFFCDYCMKHPNFIQGRYNTHFVSDFYEPDLEHNRLICKYSKNLPDPSIIALMAGVLFERNSTQNEYKTSTVTSTSPNIAKDKPWWAARRN